MRTKVRLVLLLGLLLGPVAVSVGQQNEISQGFHDSTPEGNDAMNRDVDQNSTSIFTMAQAQDLLAHTICAGKACTPGARDFYAVIHILKWTDLQSDKTQTVAGEHWYVYHPEAHGWRQDQFTDAKRLFNARSFYLLYVDLHVSTTVSYTPLYQIKIARKLPQNIANIFALLQEAAHPGQAPLLSYSNQWGGRIIMVGERPSDITIDPRTIPDPAKPGTSTEIATAQTFNNEGKYWWDVSVAVPVKKISDLKFDSTNNTVTPVQTSTQNLFAILDLYPKPVDLSQTNYSFIPHPIAGVSLASQPLHKILVGGSVGFYFAEVYAGVLLVKEQGLSGLSTGSPATPAQVTAASKYSYDHQFTVGINLPVRSIFNSVKPKQ